MAIEDVVPVTEREKLKPCPFCGGEAELWRASADRRRSAWIACMGKCAVLITKEHTTDDDAIAAWNRRAGMAITPIDAR